MYDFDIHYCDVFETQNRLREYVSELSEACQELNAIIVRLEEAVSQQKLSGSGADAIRDYFVKRHRLFCESLCILLETLLKEYSLEFFRRFLDAPISEERECARWSSTTMSLVQERLNNQIDNNVDCAERNFASAQSILLGQGPVALCAQDWKKSVNDLISSVKELQDAISELDSGAAGSFSRDSCAPELRQTLQTALSSCSEGCFVTNSATASSAFDELWTCTKAFAERVKEGAEEVHELNLISAQREYEHSERLVYEQETEQFGWMMASLVFTLAGVVIGAMGLFAVASAAFPVVFFTAVGVGSRVVDSGFKATSATRVILQRESNSKSGGNSDSPNFVNEAAKIKTENVFSEDAKKMGNGKFSADANINGKRFSNRRNCAIGRAADIAGFSGNSNLQHALDYSNTALDGLGGLEDVFTKGSSRAAKGGGAAQFGTAVTDAFSIWGDINAENAGRKAKDSTDLHHRLGSYLQDEQGKKDRGVEVKPIADWAVSMLT